MKPKNEEISDYEKRINYLAMVLKDFMENTGAGEIEIEYDGQKLNGYYLYQDILDELDIKYW